MKKLVKLGLLFSILGMITGCSLSGKEKSATYVLDQEGAKTTITMKAKGDKVIEQKVVNEISYANIGLTKEEAEATFNPIAEQFEGLEGVSEKVVYKEDMLVETLVIDFEKADLRKVSELPGSEFDEDAIKNGVSFKKTAKAYEEMGAKKQ
ncbi:DUF1307 domain-containing protein [Isobaculum melis]|uniref:Uncharacterized lipoprotein YehR, DUF1307 family n=1 Tax=Isobaculum melis TaxID=142588 RepID=A0A1H9T735_9LACT|nr:DUF1307 domain-containing protein [Isobaculum melis]SER93042.1 Uncharacterized lipoprotein YehR, DUF1307 family [Isobaculum melis]